MPEKPLSTVRVLPDAVANKIAAGEVVERPASAVKELVENALDAGATRLSVRLVAAGRRLIEVQDNGHGMSEQNALLAIERHATSKIRKAEDLDNIRTLGFRGEALASIASVSRFVLVTRRAEDENAVMLRVEGGILREVQQMGAPIGTRISVNRLYFNTPVRAKFLKGITTELNHCIDIVQRLALANTGVGFQLTHNDRMLLDVPEHASLRDRIALIWGLGFVRDMVEVEGEKNGFTVKGLVGTPELTRASRSHQFFFVNGRPVSNPSLQYGLQDAFRGLLTVGRHSTAVLLLTLNPRQVDVNIHPTKREIRFREERAAHDAVRDIVRDALSRFSKADAEIAAAHAAIVTAPHVITEEIAVPPTSQKEEHVSEELRQEETQMSAPVQSLQSQPVFQPPQMTKPEPAALDSETKELPGFESRHIAHETLKESRVQSLVPHGCFEPLTEIGDAPLQLFETYLLVPDGERLLIIDQHALHERLNYDALLSELENNEYPIQQLVVSEVFEVAPSQVALLESHLDDFMRLGIELESFGGTSFQVSGVCHLYNESRIPDVVLDVLEHFAQGRLFDQETMWETLLRTATRACKASIKAGDSLTSQERRHLLDGFRKLRPPYTCPHGRPILVEITRQQMEKSFRRIQ